MARPLDLASQAALAARAIPRLPTRADLAAFGDVAAQGFNILIIETLAIGAVLGALLPPPPTRTTATPARPTIATIATITARAAIATTFAFAA